MVNDQAINLASMHNDLATLSASVRDYLGADHRMLINGDWLPAASGKTFPLIDPSSGIEFARVAEANSDDIDKAVSAARTAFDEGHWPQLKPVQRERVILKLADLLERHAEEFAQIESVNSGRTVPNCRAFDVDLSVDYLRYMAGWATKIRGETFSPSVPYVPGADFFSFTLREPVGVVAGITPWNVPLGQAIWKVAPVLATGCTMVLKPAEQTPLTALRFGELIAEAGIPPGVINIATGFGETAGAALVKHPGVDKIAFTGSTEVGRIIATTAAEQFKRYTLELGGKSAVIVLPDVDLELAVPGAAMAIFGNHGQNCCAGSRLFVHKEIYDRVIDGVVQIAESIKLGAPLNSDTDMGPLVSHKQQKRVLGYIESGLAEGAELAAGGHAVTDSGAYVQPTVLTNINSKMKVVQEEIFGPVLVATQFEEIDDVIRRANDTKFGLGASLWTRDVSKVHRLIPRLKAGTVWVNTHNVLDIAVPFGGMKNSGVGRELGEEAIRHHTELKTATISL